MSYAPIKETTDGQKAFGDEFNGNFTADEVSKDSLMAGDIVSFYYQGSERFGLIVKSRRSNWFGVFKSTRGNTLVNIFLLHSITNSDCRIIIKTLYRNRIRATYLNSPKILGAFLGKENFRTFNKSYISDIKNYIITDISKAKQEQESDLEEELNEE
jgi:hypothetical protein